MFCRNTSGVRFWLHSSMKCAPLSELSLNSTPLLARMPTGSPRCGEAADQRRAVGRLVFVEAAAVDHAGDQLAHVELHLDVAGMMP
jgi:hypothetical protein